MTQFEKMFNILKKPWVTVIWVVIVLLVYQYADRWLATYFYQLDIRNNVHILNILTNLGKMYLYIVAFLLVGLYFHYFKINAVYEARAWYLLTCIVVPNVICAVLKVVIGRARPELFLINDIFGFYGFKLSSLYWSLPSGHTTTVVALVGGLSLLFPKCFYWVFALAIFVILTRVFLYYHYLSDVLASFYLCVIIVGLLAQYLKRNHYFSKAFQGRGEQS